MSTDDLETFLAGITIDDGVFAARGNAPDQAARVRDAVALLGSDLVGGMCLLRKCLADGDVPPPIDAVLDSGIMPLIVLYLDPEAHGSSLEVLHEASWAMLNMMSGDDAQTSRVVQIPHAVPAIIALLSNSAIPCRTREHAAWALGNIAGTGDAYRSELALQGCFPLLMAFLNDCVSEGFSLENGLWSMSNFVRRLNNVPTNTLPYLSYIPGLISCVLRSSNAYKNGAQLLWLLSYLVQDTVDECLQQGYLAPVVEFLDLVGQTLPTVAPENFELLAHAWLSVVVHISAGDDAATIVLVAGETVPTACETVFVVVQQLVPQNPSQWLPVVSCGLLALNNIIVVPAGAAKFRTDFPVRLLECLMAYAQKFMNEYIDSTKFVARTLSGVVKEALILVLHLIDVIPDDPMRALLYCTVSPIVESTERPESWVWEDRWRTATQRCLDAATVLHAQQHPCVPELLAKLRIHAAEAFI
jgi:hypothetical protein